MQRSNADNRHDRHFRISSTWISILLSFVLGGIFMSQIRQVEMIGRHNNYQTMAEEASFMMKTNSLVGKWKDEERRTSNERGVVTEDGWVCKGFFTVMATAFTNDHGERDACNKLFNGRRYYRSLLKDHNQQMLKMNTTLTIFTTWTKEQLSERPELCRLDHLPGLKVQSFDPIQILKNQQFTNEQIEWIQHWLNAKSKERTQRYKHHRVAARLADLWRVVLAKEYQMAYIELDMLLLNPYKETYLQHSNVAVPVWSEENGMLEIQNSGFCFSRQQLNVILQKQQSIIQFRGPSQAIADNYELYTELGPNVFLHSIQEMNRLGPPVRFYMTSSNGDYSVIKVVNKCKQFGPFEWLHLDGTFRGKNTKGGLNQSLLALREQCRDDLPASSSRS